MSSTLKSFLLCCLNSTVEHPKELLASKLQFTCTSYLTEAKAKWMLDTGYISVNASQKRCLGFVIYLFCMAGWKAIKSLEVPCTWRYWEYLVAKFYFPVNAIKSRDLLIYLFLETESIVRFWLLHLLLPDSTENRGCDSYKAATSSSVWCSSDSYKGIKRSFWKWGSL